MAFGMSPFPLRFGSRGGGDAPAEPAEPGDALLLTEDGDELLLTEGGDALLLLEAE